MLKYSIKLNEKLHTNSLRQFPFWFRHQIQSRNTHNEQKSPKSQKTFKNVVTERQLQAKRSIFIESPNATKSVHELIAHCAKFGTIRNVFRKEVESKSFFLVEFSNFSGPNQIIRSAHHLGSNSIDGKVRTCGRFLSFTPSDTIVASKQRQPVIIKEKNISDHKLILNAMRKKTSIDDQIMELYNVNQLSDLSSRLRFFTALQIEEAISGIFHSAQVLPFGSSINGFGRMQSDLDMVVMSFGNRTSKSPFESLALGKSSDMTRYTIRNNLFVLSGILRHWLQGVDEVTPVLNARVPIIKYVQRLTQLDCDLSMGNFSGFQMSEMLYTFGELDRRVRPFLFFIRTWAKEFDILQPFPAAGLSNFMITCLVIFFLQQQKLLPPADAFVTFPKTNENIQYITDTSKLNFKSVNTSTLSELLTEFFEYYGSFDFKKDAPSIQYGVKKANIGNDSMYIYNPLDNGLNVSRNVTDFEMNQFTDKCKISHESLTKGNTDAVDLLDLYNRITKRDKQDIHSRHMQIDKLGNQKSRKDAQKIDIKQIIPLE